MEDSLDKTICTRSSRLVIIPTVKAEDSGDETSDFTGEILIKCPHTSLSRPFRFSQLPQASLLYESYRVGPTILGSSGSTHYLFDDLSPIDPQIGRYDTFVVRRIFNKSKMLLRPLDLSTPIRGELEIAEFGTHLSRSRLRRLKRRNNIDA